MISNVLIDLGATINFMTIDMVEKIFITRIQSISIMFQLDNSSITKLEGVIEYLLS
jgi:hypothetical protein